VLPGLPGVGSVWGIGADRDFSIEKDEEEAHFEDFILSCRVMGRNVEDAMLAVATEEARRLGANNLIAEYRPTEKNAPCLEFWQDSEFETGDSEHVFRWTLGETYPVPDHIDLVRNDEFANVAR